MTLCSFLQVVRNDLDDYLATFVLARQYIVSDCCSVGSEQKVDERALAASSKTHKCHD